MNKYLFLFYYEGILLGWECFDPKEPVSDSMAVQQAFNMLVCDDDYTHVLVYSYDWNDGRALICSIYK